MQELKNQVEELRDSLAAKASSNEIQEAAIEKYNQVCLILKLNYYN